MTRHALISPARSLRLALVLPVLALLSACAETSVSDKAAVDRGLNAFISVCMGNAPRYDSEPVQRLFATKYGYTQPWVRVNRATGATENLDTNVTRHADGGLAGAGLFGVNGGADVGCLVYVPTRNTDGLAQALAGVAAAQMPISSSPLAARNNVLFDRKDTYIRARDKTGTNHVIVVSFKPEFKGQPLNQTLLMIAPSSAFRGL